MGRELKRVPLNFDAPLKETWQGYINPYTYPKCPECDGDGFSEDARGAKDRWYGYRNFNPLQNGSKLFTSENPIIKAMAKRNIARHEGMIEHSEVIRLVDHFNANWSHHLNKKEVAALLEAGRLMTLTHIWDEENGWQKKIPAYIPTPEEVNEWSLDGMGHDCINSSIIIETWCKEHGLPYNCSKCNGRGTVEGKILEEFESWEAEDPPYGEGYQLWENTSEGSPLSPVFKTLKELCVWAEDGATIFGNSKASKEDWYKMLDDGMVCHEEGNMVFI